MFFLPRTIALFSQDELNAAVNRVSGKQEEWFNVGVDAKIGYVTEMIRVVDSSLEEVLRIFCSFRFVFFLVNVCFAFVVYMHTVL